MSQAQAICPVCKSTALISFLTRASVPVHQNFVIKTLQSALAFNKGDLSLMLCKSCGFIFNQTFDLSLLSYGDDYENAQYCSPLFRKYMDDLSNYLVNEKGVKNARIVEVGCGQGTFLKTLVEPENLGNIGYGFDPSYVGPETLCDGRLTFIKSYYDAAYSHIETDVVVSRHVIEHVPNPVDMLKTLRQALSGSPNPKVFFETPCIEWILENKVFWDFFYEHCSYFSASSLKTAFELAGFVVDDVKHIFEGQYLWIEASIPTANQAVEVTKNPDHVIHLAREYQASDLGLRNFWHEKLQELQAQGKVAIWGAGAKGVTFANLVDPARQLVDCIVDINPKKQNHFIPGTGHPIVDYKALKERNVKAAVLMNPNYRKENSILLEEAQLEVALIE